MTSVQRERWSDGSYKGSAHRHADGNTHGICRVCRGILPIVRGRGRGHQAHGRVCRGRTARTDAEPDGVRLMFAGSHARPRRSRWHGSRFAATRKD